MELAKMIVEVIASVSVIVASGAAIYGINAWRREFKGKRDIELAEEVLALFYEARDAIKSIRSPLGFQGEGSTRKPQEGETPEQKAARDSVYVVFERYEKRQEPFNKLRSKRYQFMVRFGYESIKPFDDIEQIVREIFGAARRLAHLYVKNMAASTAVKENQHSQQVEKHETIFWDTFGEDDPINPRLDQVISDIERICRPIIMEQKGIVPFFRRLWSKRPENKKSSAEGAH